MAWTEEVARFLMVRRKEAKMTQEQIADATNRTKSSVSKWELGKVEPSPEIKDQLAELLDMHRCWLDGFLPYSAELRGRHSVEGPERTKPATSGANLQHPSTARGAAAISGENTETFSSARGKEEGTDQVPGGTIVASSDGVWGEARMDAVTEKGMLWLEVTEDYLPPWFAVGNLVGVNHELKVRSGDFVVAKVRDKAGGERWLIGRSEISRGRNILHSTSQPEQTVELDATPEWSTIHMIDFRPSMRRERQNASSKTNPGGPQPAN